MKGRRRIALGTRGTRRRRKLKYIAVLPSLVTFMNGICGFTAIAFASRGLGVLWEPEMFPTASFSFFALAGYMIFLGMVADVMDGHIARISKSTSSFGAQLDSLCDVISFGVAPAFLMVKLVEAYSHSLQAAGHGAFVIPGRIVYLTAIVYVMCAIIRLARFNVETKTDDTHLGFVGLPSPPAAGVIVSMVVFQQDFLPRISAWFDVPPNSFAMVTIWFLPAVTLMAGLLMVTRIPYPHVVNRILRGKKRFSTFLIILFVLPLMVWNIQLTMAVGFSFFALYGAVRWIVVKIFHGRKRETDAAQSAERNLGSGI